MIASSSRSRTAPSGRALSELSFEAAQKELEGIVERLERGDAELAELTRLWERGEELYKLCEGMLADAQGRIEELARRVEEAR